MNTKFVISKRNEALNRILNKSNERKNKGIAIYMGKTNRGKVVVVVVVVAAAAAAAAAAAIVHCSCSRSSNSKSNSTLENEGGGRRDKEVEGTVDIISLTLTQIYKL